MNLSDSSLWFPGITWHSGKVLQRVILQARQPQISAPSLRVSLVRHVDDIDGSKPRKEWESSEFLFLLDLCNRISSFHKNRYRSWSGPHRQRGAFPREGRDSCGAFGGTRQLSRSSISCQVNALRSSTACALPQSVPAAEMAVRAARASAMQDYPVGYRLYV